MLPGRTTVRVVGSAWVFDPERLRRKSESGSGPLALALFGRARQATYTNAQGQSRTGVWKDDKAILTYKNIS